MYGNPLRYIDPSGHDPHCGPDGIHCGVDPTQATTGFLLGPQWNNNSGSASSGGGDNGFSGTQISGGAAQGLGHNYTVGPNPVCLDMPWIHCTESEVNGYLRRWQYPGQWPGSPVVSGQYYNVAPAYIFCIPTPLCYVGMCGSGAIEVKISNNGATITNATRLTHIFNVGDVQRTRSQDANGNYYVTTHGQGINDGYDLFGFVPIRGQTIDRANQAVGPIVFQAMDYGLLAYTTIIETGQHVSTFLP